MAYTSDRKVKDAGEVNYVKVPHKVLEALKGQPAGLKPWLEKIHSDMGLTVDYNGQILRLSSGCHDILDLAVETVERWIGPIPDTGTVNMLEKGKVVWRFHGDYVNVIHKFFASELEKAKKVNIVKVAYFPDEESAAYVEISCGYDHYANVRDQIQSIADKIDMLYVDTVPIQRDREVARARLYASQQDPDDSIVCIYNEKKRRLMIYGASKKDVQKTLLGYTKS